MASWNEGTAPRYIDSKLSDGVTYYYVVAARNEAGVSAPSGPVHAEPAAAGPLPSEWSNSDIGSAGGAGGATHAEVGGNTFIAKGAGGNIGEGSDTLNFTHRAVAGDFIFVARMVSADWSGRDKIGLLVRESTAPDAKAVAVTLGDIGNRQCRFGTRLETAASMIWQAGNDYTWLPVWFKIQRAGDVFPGYQSVDGTNWFKVGSSTSAMADECRVGLAITGLKNQVFNTTVFDHVTVQNVSK